ncbi:MAG: hypothetical protein K6T92_09935 [Candidatus Rokubacteria bacterium]|nr:hypothetical protein [Candidatus Rokubacteria bacterium]
MGQPQPVSQGRERYERERARIEQGHPKYREKLRAEGKLFVRDRLKLLLDPDSEFQEDWLFARSEDPDTPADGVVTGVGRVGGRTVCVMANDYTVKAGSWGEKTVQKIIRIQERAARLQVPLLYLVDAAGGRISEQIRVFPGRFHAGRIFYNEVQLSGVVPQVCILFGPSPAGSAYLPALTDVVAGEVPMMMVDLAIGLPMIKEGKVKAYGVTSPTRVRAMPDLPTIAEAGLPGYVATGWFSVVARAGTPPPIIEKLNDVLMAYLRRAEVKDRLEALAIEPLTSTPDALERHIAAEIKKWAQVVKDAGIEPQ